MKQVTPVSHVLTHGSNIVTVWVQLSVIVLLLLKAILDELVEAEHDLDTHLTTTNQMRDVIQQNLSSLKVTMEKT